ncbi:haloacid dehalogenase [Bifidobacterium lemurum]|uniref:Haloacid dehalogenase n=1 Tax=Bifidobacterium lemurum TaxID=1603886 RepID=A0A261FRY1_9BIFI|nr:HAD family hydrolase [Bifidobacterium lemurum]OZG61941.1 haloacid dehalogenase [Bifidobacterium lemurum]QOL35280.1 HAD family hydrolase [Bifidobacterium lemurum]
MAYRLVLWDFDGTLADTGADVWRSLAWAARSCGGALPDSFMADDRNLGLSVAEIHRRIEPYPGDGSLDRYDRLVTTHYRGITDYPSTALYPGIEALLRDLHGLGVVNHIVTHKPRQALERILAIKGWTGLFEGWDCADQYDDGSPSLLKTLMVRSVMERRGADPADTVMVGDTFGDIVAARANGIDSIAVTYGDGDAELLRDSRPTHCVDGVDELADTIRKGL